MNHTHTHTPIRTEMDRFIERVGSAQDPDPDLTALPFHLACVIRATRVLMTRDWATATIRGHLQHEIDELLEDYRQNGDPTEAGRP